VGMGQGPWNGMAKYGPWPHPMIWDHPWDHPRIILEGAYGPSKGMAMHGPGAHPRIEWYGTKSPPERHLGRGQGPIQGSTVGMGQGPIRWNWPRADRGPIRWYAHVWARGPSKDPPWTRPTGYPREWPCMGQAPIQGLTCMGPGPAQGCTLAGATAPSKAAL